MSVPSGVVILPIQTVYYKRNPSKCSHTFASSLMPQKMGNSKLYVWKWYSWSTRFPNNWPLSLWGLSEVLSRVEVFLLSLLSSKMGRVWIIRSPCCFAGSHGENRCAKEIGPLYQPICENKTSLRGRLGGAFLILPREKRSNQKKTSTETSNKLAVTKCWFLFNNSNFPFCFLNLHILEGNKCHPVKQPFLSRALSSSTVNRTYACIVAGLFLPVPSKLVTFLSSRVLIGFSIKVESAKSQVFAYWPLIKRCHRGFFHHSNLWGKRRSRCFREKKTDIFWRLTGSWIEKWLISRGP